MKMCICRWSATICLLLIVLLSCDDTSAQSNSQVFRPYEAIEENRPVLTFASSQPMFGHPSSFGFGNREYSSQVAAYAALAKRSELQDFLELSPGERRRIDRVVENCDKWRESRKEPSNSDETEGIVRDIEQDCRVLFDDKQTRLLEQYHRRRLACTIGIANLVKSIPKESSPIEFTPAEKQAIQKVELQVTKTLGAEMDQFQAHCLESLLNVLSEEQRKSFSERFLTVKQARVLCPEMVLAQLASPNSNYIPLNWKECWSTQTMYEFPVDSLFSETNSIPQKLNAGWRVITVLRTMPSYQDALLLTEDQIAAFEALNEQVTSRHGVIYKEPLREKEIIRKEYEQLGEYSIKQVEAILLPHQVAILNELARREAVSIHGALATLLDKEIQKELRVRTSQRDELKQIAKELHEELTQKMRTWRTLAFEKDFREEDNELRAKLSSFFGADFDEALPLDPVGLFRFRYSP